MLHQATRLYGSIKNPQKSYCKWFRLRFEQGNPQAFPSTSYVWHRQPFRMTGEDTMQSGSTQGSTDRSAEKAPTSACVCGECRSTGQCWSGYSRSAHRQILPIYASPCSGDLQNREIPPIHARLSTADLQIREAHLIHARLWNGRLQNRQLLFICARLRAGVRCVLEVKNRKAIWTDRFYSAILIFHFRNQSINFD